MLVNTLLLSAVLTGTSLTTTIANKPDPDNFKVTLCKSEVSSDCYTEAMQDGVCHKVKDPKTYGDKGSFFRINAPDNWQCELFELDDCTNPADSHHSFSDVAVYSDPGCWSWDKDWMYASYKCWKN